METVINSTIGRPPIAPQTLLNPNTNTLFNENNRKLNSSGSSSSLDKYLPSSIRDSPKLLAMARTPRTLMAMNGINNNSTSSTMPSLDLNDDNFMLNPTSGDEEGGRKNFNNKSNQNSTSSSSCTSPTLNLTEDIPRSPARKVSEVVSYSMGNMKNCDFINDMEMTLPEGTPKRKQKIVSDNTIINQGSPGLWNQLHSPSSK